VTRSETLKKKKRIHKPFHTNDGERPGKGANGDINKHVSLAILGSKDHQSHHAASYRQESVHQKCCPRKENKKKRKSSMVGNIL